MSETPSVIDQLKEILLKTLKGGDYDLEAIQRELTPQSHFTTEIQMDSLDLVDFVVAVETHFGLRIPQKEYEELRTLEAVTRYIKKLS